MFLQTNKSCEFCAVNKYRDGSTTPATCKACPAACPNACASATLCLECPDTAKPIYDLKTKTCVATCSMVTITINSKKYCRENKIYVDSTSASDIELGTMEYPYKQIFEGFMEVFNYWDTNLTSTVEVLVKEETNNTLVSD